MSKYCTSCGSPIPDGQGNSCSMCYGDIAHGTDGYYENWAREQDKMNYAPFYSGQKVVALSGGSTNLITKGTVYTVDELFQFACGCWAISLVGVKKFKNHKTHCGYHPDNISDKYDLFSVVFFAPIIERFESITFEKILEKEICSVN